MSHLLSWFRPLTSLKSIYTKIFSIARIHTVCVSRVSEIGLGQGEPVAKNFKDSEKFNEITVNLRRAACALRINRRRTLNGQWADPNRTVGEPWRPPMLAFGSLSAHKQRTHGESRVCSVAEQSCQSSLHEPIKSQHHPLQGFLPPRLSRSYNTRPLRKTRRWILTGSCAIDKKCWATL